MATKLTFLMGGAYSLCVSDDGSFAGFHADIWPIRVQVNGVFDLNFSPNTVADYLRLHKRYHCYLLRKA